jgi:hypothetical protein
MEIQELKAIIKESIREVLREERMLLCQVLIPYVSDEEQEELDEMLGSPSDYEDEKEKQLSELRRKIAEGTEQIRQGEVIEGELVFQQLQEKLKQMEQAE